MAEIDQLLRTTFGEMVRVMAAKTVVGDPITVDDKTVIPLIKVSMGYGAGAGGGKEGEGQGGGAGGGISIKPLAVIIMDKEGVRVAQVSAVPHSTMDRLTDTIPKILESVPRLLEKHKGHKPEELPAQEEKPSRKEIPVE